MRFNDGLYFLGLLTLAIFVLAEPGSEDPAAETLQEQAFVERVNLVLSPDNGTQVVLSSDGGKPEIEVEDRGESRETGFVVVTAQTLQTYEIRQHPGKLALSVVYPKGRYEIEVELTDEFCLNEVVSTDEEFGVYISAGTCRY